jgi:hypothetical protein
MNVLDKMRRRNDILRLCTKDNHGLGGLYWGAGERPAHIRQKLEVCMWLKKQDSAFMTEVRFKSGDSRCDILALDHLNGCIIEVVDSESIESIEEKKRKYPLPVIVVKASDKWKPELIL